MTCIVAIKEGKKVYIGGDSSAVKGDRKYRCKTPKVFQRGNFLIGGAGSLKVLQTMGYTATIPPIHENQDSLEYLINGFLPEVRNAIDEVGRLERTDNKESTLSEFLIGFRRRLFEISGDLSIIEVEDDYAAIGSGSSYALGSLYSTKDSDLSPEERIQKALEVAYKHDPYVEPPFEILDMEQSTSISDLFAEA